MYRVCTGGGRRVQGREDEDAYSEVVGKALNEEIVMLKNIINIHCIFSVLLFSIICVFTFKYYNIKYTDSHYGEVIVDNIKHSFYYGDKEVNFLDLIPGRFSKVCLVYPYEVLAYEAEIERAGYNVEWGTDESRWAVLMFLSDDAAVPAPIPRSQVGTFEINTESRCLCEKATALISAGKKYSKYEIKINNELCQ